MSQYNPYSVFEGVCSLSGSASTDSEVGAIYATFWRLLFTNVHEYGSTPTGGLLVVMTILLLDRAGYSPTIADLIEIIGLPKTSVSRYVSVQIKNGFLKEDIDPQDRRRRFLRPTPKARKHRKWHQDQTLKLVRLSSDAIRGLGESRHPVSDLKNILLGINETFTDPS
jgi:DNA-binding MarR family transcriptional regulator